MAAKNTEELENELSLSRDIEEYLSVNDGERKERTLSEYLNELLMVKKLSKAEVIESSLLEKLTLIIFLPVARRIPPGRRRWLWPWQ